jgi:hypothetical protein
MPEPNKNQERAKNNITSDHVISINKYKNKKKIYKQLVVSASATSLSENQT